MLTFLKAGLTNLKQTGSLVESSRYLSKCMTSIVDFDKPLHIIELGAGTGSVTKSVLAQMNSSSRLSSFEINGSLFTKFSHEMSDSRLSKINDSALLLGNYVKAGSVNYILSCLPLSNMSSKDKNTLLSACKSALKPNGYLIQFQYSLEAIGFLKRHFAEVSYDFTLFNLPPAFIYYAKK